MTPRSNNKYGARQVTYENIRFDSELERDRYLENKFRQAAGEIKDLKIQPRFPLDVNGVTVGHYTPDSTYLVLGSHPHGVVEDCKSSSTMTEASNLRIKVFEALYGIQVTIVTREQVRRMA